jgi:hypothetical protein
MGWVKNARATRTGSCTTCRRQACVCRQDERRALRSAMAATCRGCGYTRCKCRRSK